MLSSTMEGQNAKELETEIIGFIKSMDATVDSATHVNQVISALQPLASMLFDVQKEFAPGDADGANPKQVVEIQRWKNIGQEAFSHAFYRGISFPTVANILLFKVATNWLACFPFSARTLVFDKFFLNAPASEALQALMLGLAYDYTYAKHEEIDVHAVRSNAERVLILCLVESKGVKKIALEFGISSEVKTPRQKMQKVQTMESISRIAQLVVSIPDKARLEAPKALSAHQFLQEVTTQLLDAAEERFKQEFEKFESTKEDINDGTFTFIGEAFSRICRRGHADVVASEMVPRLLQHIKICLDSREVTINTYKEVEKNCGSSFWQAIAAAIKDSHAMQRWTEALLHQMTVANINDVEAYWIIWTLFNTIFENQGSIRTLFTEKFLFWKVFPVSCLRWILQFAVFRYSPVMVGCLQEQTNRIQFEVVRHLVELWAKRDFVQQASMSQQAYISAAVGLSMQKMTKKDLESCGDMLHSLLQGVSCRLDSPITPVRKMASCVALVFSKVIDAKNPLFLDDDNCEEEIDWDFGVTGKRKETAMINSHHSVGNHDDTKKPVLMVEHSRNHASNESVKTIDASEDNEGTNSSRMRGQRKKNFVLKVDDPDEVIDPATLNAKDWSDEDDNESVISENSSESSLLPYDMEDDESDLKREKIPSQLSDCVTALRKADDPDAVLGALEVTEKLVRAMPDELNMLAVDLVRALVHVQCSAITVEGEEESAEEKRHRSLVALLVSCPLKSVDVLTKELYSPNVDVSQRLLTLDVMADAAQELAKSRDMNRSNYGERRLDSAITELTSEAGSNPWYLPSSKISPPGAGPWRKVSDSRTMVSWSNRYERELPSRSGDNKLGKSRRWGHRSLQHRENQLNQFDSWSKNRFPAYAAAFMLPVMHGYDKRKHGVDFLGRDFVVLGRLIYMLGVCMECMALHPEASALAPALLDMLNSRQISNHPEAYVRRSALFAASRILIALHPSFIATALSGGDHEISRQLEWVRNWALHVAEVDSDYDCSMMATACVQLHSEMALQAFRSIKSIDDSMTGHGKTSYHVPKGSILLPGLG